MAVSKEKRTRELIRNYGNVEDHIKNYVIQRCEIAGSLRFYMETLEEIIEIDGIYDPVKGANKALEEYRKTSVAFLSNLRKLSNMKKYNAYKEPGIDEDQEIEEAEDGE